MDGARIFNAAVALDTDVASLTRSCDSVMFCLSKGLGAPVGSMLLGSREFIDRARSLRKLLGGGMRQAGILAAAGLIALEKMPARLHEDHANARLLAELLEDIPGLSLSSSRVRTNILVVRIEGAELDSAKLALHPAAERRSGWHDRSAHNPPPDPSGRLSRPDSSSSPGFSVRCSSAFTPNQRPGPISG